MTRSRTPGRLTTLRRYWPLAVTLPITAIGFMQLVRAAPVQRLSGPVPPPSDPAFREALHATLGIPLVPGSTVELLLNGEELFPRMWGEMERAERSISLYSFFWDSGEVARRLREVLAERARAGVNVRVLYDQLGAMGHGGSAFDELRSAGAEAVPHRPAGYRSWHAIHRRSHARYLLIDDQIAYTGGFGFADQWSGSGRRKGEWRDSAVRVQGGLVPPLDAGFRSLWAEASGELIADPGGGGDPAPGTGREVEALAFNSSPTSISMPVERMFALSIASARERLYLSIAYFIPNTFFSGLLADAARRGVDVRVLTANRRSDVPPAWWAGRTRYDRLLRSGVRIYEYQPSMMHAKTLVSDGIWSLVGAMNLDNQSLTNLDESGVAVLDRGFGHTMEETFFDDLERSNEILLEEFRRRPLYERAVERGASAISRVL